MLAGIDAAGEFILLASRILDNSTSSASVVIGPEGKPLGADMAVLPVSAEHNRGAEWPERGRATVRRSESLAILIGVVTLGQGHERAAAIRLTICTWLVLSYSCGVGGPLPRGTAGDRLTGKNRIGRQGSGW